MKSNVGEKSDKLIAHVKQEKTGEWIVHSLEEHLDGVAGKSEKFASQFGSGDWVRAAALLHDLGKGSSDFQKYICAKSGYNPDAHIEDAPGRVNHSTHGADWANKNYPQIGKILAYLIAGHHAGLPDWNNELGVGGNLQYRLKTEEVEKLPRLSEQFIIETTEKAFSPTSAPCKGLCEEEQFHLWIRMLYSSLVDADFLDTEQFMDHEKFNIRGLYASISKLKEQFDVHMDRLISSAESTTVNKVRQQVLSQCRGYAEKEAGLFTLTVPTGGGKTLSSMAFALEHSIIHGKERIIMVIPYTSIIEQTSKIYKEIFGEENVIEHHSSLDPDRETSRSRLATENWDAPIIVTTSVQFFESLFAARSSSCRKLHNIVNSVVIVDEVQMLPTDYLKPILQSIKGLTNHFGVSMVLMTATQPAITDEIFEKGNGEHYSILEREHCREIMVSPSPDELTESLQRVEVIEKGEFSEWSVLAEELKHYEQVLCIVSTRKDCRDLYRNMPVGTVHLSANMCGEHRSRIIDGIKEKLEQKRKGIFNESIRVISTQLVEAGVDFDFPVVFRAMAGFDSIAQAAGRCNREGKLQEKGKVFVFESPKQAPPGALRKGAQSGKTILCVDPDGCKSLKPATFRKYFQLYFSDLNTFDKQDIEGLLVKNASSLNFQFRTAAQKFNIIDDRRQVSIVVWYDGEKVNSKELIKTLRFAGPSRELMRRFQRFTVSIPEKLFFEVRGSFEDIHGIWCQCADTLYDDVLGFVGYEGDFPVCV